MITSLLLAENGFGHGFGTRRFTPGDYPPDIHVLRQVHGERIVILTEGRRQVAESGRTRREHDRVPVVAAVSLPADPFRFSEGDALITDVPGILIGVRTADCLPILVADPKTGAVAAIHCGWRSAARGLAEKGVRALADLTGSSPGGFVAALGPAIGPCHYEVGPEVKEAFAAGGQDADVIFEERGQSLYLDLLQACTLQLQAAGIKTENIDNLEECTVCRNDMYYSWRAEKGEERMVSFIAAGRADRVQVPSPGARV